VTPDPSSGIGVAPGTATGIAFARVDRERLYVPWGSCNEAWHIDNGGSDPVGYSKAQCERNCYRTAVADTCGCLLLPWPTALAARPSLYVCSLAEASCIATTQASFNAGQLGCGAKCPDRCQETAYDPVVGVQAWPSLSSAATVLAIVKNTRQDTSIGASYLAQNMLSLRVYPRTMEYQTIKTVRAYSFESLLSEVGGNTGLWAGMSALTVVELIEFAILAVAACACAGACRRRCGCGGSQRRAVGHTPGAGSAYDASDKSAFAPGKAASAAIAKEGTFAGENMALPAKKHAWSSSDP